ncbi:MAG: hypothetical protein JW776_00805 [Candidatus Lokiarchaeota archaeon]|nr:hypothetical protein [Candidatus Lokiarchaeota archaeon]
MILQDYIAGFSAGVILLTGYITGILTIIKGAKQKASLMVWSGLFLVLMGQFYLGTVASFVKLLLTGANLTPQFPLLAARLCYTGSPIAITIAMYVGFSMIKPEWRYNATLFYGVTSVFYWLGMFVPRYESINLAEEIPIRSLVPYNVGLVDVSLEGWVLILTAIYLLSMLVFNTSGLLVLAKKSSGLIRKKAIVQSFGYFIFVVIGAVDSLFELAEWIFIPRIIMVIGYILLAYGYQATK